MQQEEAPAPGWSGCSQTARTAWLQPSTGSARCGGSRGQERQHMWAYSGTVGHRDTAVRPGAVCLGCARRQAASLHGSAAQNTPGMQAGPLAALTGARTGRQPALQSGRRPACSGWVAAAWADQGTARCGTERGRLCKSYLLRGLGSSYWVGKPCKSSNTRKIHK